MSKKALTVIGALVYVLSPIDIVPDVIPILGWIDDGGVIMATIAVLMKKDEPKPVEARKA